MNSENDKSDSQRPHSQHASESFSRAMQLSSKFYPRVEQASGPQDGTTDLLPLRSQDQETDTFKRDSHDIESQESLGISEKLLDSFDKLPAELANISEHFIDSLSAKVHRSPPSIDKLSSLFQDFYEIASHHIHTHLSSTPAHQNYRQRATTTSLSSTITSAGGKLKANIISAESFNRPKSSSGKESLVQQMLTSEEIADRREVRKMLGLKRVALEEAVERKVCEATYNQIWRHRSTHDEERDEKLRSRTAALSLVGIGLRDLGVDLGVEDNENSTVAKEKEAEVAEWLSEARTELCAMNDLKYPLGKLQHLKSAHKAIVETLSHFHPSSSADEIMPMLIYTLITSRTEGINIMSNLHFIQRFRNANKIDGEAAYCLTNLEAAISFVETVDLASLRADEVLSGPPKHTSRTNTPSPEIFDPLINPLTPSTSVSATESPYVSPTPHIVKEELSPTRSRHRSQTQSRRLNDLFESSTSLGAASDAVLSSADQGLESIGNSIGDSYKFLLAKIKGRQEDEIESKDEITTKIISSMQDSVINSLDDSSQGAGYSYHHTQGAGLKTSADPGSKIEDKILSMIGGRKTSRDKSSDSSKRVSFAGDSGNGKGNSSSQNLSTMNPPIVESMRNLGNSLNPMNRIAGIGIMRAFTRSSPPATPTVTATLAPISGGPLNSGITDLTKDLPDLASDPLLKISAKIDPPISKFLEIQTPGEIKLHEVIELLQDYKRLAHILKESGMV